MRTIEISLVSILALYFIVLFLKKKKRPAWIIWIPVVAILVATMQIVLEGMRWQMYIAYVLTGAIALFALLDKIRNNKSNQVNQTRKKSKRFLAILGAIFGIILLALNTFLANLMPMPVLPEPNGPYEVGTAFFHLVDQEREEEATADTMDVRSLWAQVWYPAEQTESYKRMPALPESERYMGDLFEKFGFPYFAGRYIHSIKSHSYIDAPVKSGNQSFPIILYSHGYNGNLSGNTQKAEALASHGYVVFGIAHSYETQISLREDGSWLTLTDSNSVTVLQTLKANLDTLILNQVILAEKKIQERIGDPINQKPEDKQVFDSIYLLVDAPAQDYLQIRAADLSSVLDEIEQMQNGSSESIFKGKLDVSKVGTYGASFGGPTCALFSATDPRCLASVNIDGDQYGILHKYSLNKPHMFFVGQYGWEELQRADWENIGSAKPYYRIAIQGALHGNIGDQLFSSALTRKLGMLRMGSIKPNRVQAIYNSYLLAFFDEHLKEKEQPLLKGENRFKEVEFKEY